MAILKHGFSDAIGSNNIVSTTQITSNDAITQQFRQIVARLQSEQLKSHGRKVSPAMADFKWVSCIQMHAAEAALVDQDTGEFKKNARGEPVSGGFESVVDSKGRPSVKWISKEGLLPYKNQNGDIFPEEDLIKAHKQWIGKPLCKDHISSSVDGIRGIIVDTFYDPKFKRVHALFALDAKNYPDLARKVEAAYATNVSMGTAVGRSICTECSNVATTESDYCHHVRGKSNYGEINKDLSPIELSLVVTGADPLAKIKTVIAHMNDYLEKRASIVGDVVQPISGDTTDITSLRPSALEPATIIERLEGMKKDDLNAQHYGRSLILDKDLLKTLDSDLLNRLLRQITKHDLEGYQEISNLLANKDGFIPDTPVSDDGGPRDVSNDGIFPDSKPLDNMHEAFSTANTNSKVVGKSVASTATNSKAVSINEQAMIKNKEIPMNFAELKKRAELRRNAYHQGTEEVKKYPLMGDQDKIRDTMDKQMVGDELDTSGDIPKEDLKKKELLQRAEVEGRRERRAALLKQIKLAGEVMKKKDENGKDVLVKENADGTMETLDAKDGATKTETKKAYFQGTEVPTKYPPMGDSDKIRLKDDKQMSGQGMESGADGMHPGYGESDESVKRRMQRMASLKGKLFKGASPAQSFWKFYAGSDEVLTVTASGAYSDELNQPVRGSGRLVNASKDLKAADFFQTKAYAEEVMKLIRSAGLRKAAEELGAAMPAAPAPAAPVAPEAPVDQKEGEDKEKVEDALSGIEDACDAIRQAVGVEELKEVDVAAEPPIDSASPALPAPTASREDLIKVFATLTDVAEQISAMSDAVDAGHSEVQPLLTEAVADAEKLAQFSSNLLKSFAAKKKDVKDMKDSKVMKKDVKDAKDGKDAKKGKDVKDDMKKLRDAKDAKDAKKDAKPVKKKSDSELLADMLQARAERRQSLIALATEEATDLGEDPAALEGTSTEVDGAPVEDPAAEGDEGLSMDEIQAMLDELDTQHSGSEADDMMYADDSVSEDYGDAMMADDSDDSLSDAEAKEVQEIADEEATEAVEGHVEKLHDKAARKAWRESLVKAAKGGMVEGLPLSEDYAKTRSGGGVTTQLDTSATGDLAKVETLTETHMKMMDVARSAPRNVRMAAEKLNGLIQKGAVNASLLSELVSEGAVDAETASYWKQFYGQVDGGKDFAAGLTKDFKQAKASLSASDEVEQATAKIQRSFAVAMDAQERGMIAGSRTALQAYASQLAKLPDVAFESIKNVIAQHKKPEGKVATAAPRSGLNYDSAASDSVETARSATPAFEDLANLFLTK